jgi:hypothetical protein
MAVGVRSTAADGGSLMLKVALAPPSLVIR